MKYCLKCKHLSPSGSQNCLGCGGSFGGRRCSCGNIAIPDARYCTACGSDDLAAHAPSVPIGAYAQTALAVVCGIVPLFFLSANLHAALKAALAAWELLITFVPLLVFGAFSYWLLGSNRRIVVPLLEICARVANGGHRVIIKAIRGIARHARASGAHGGGSD